MLPKPHHVFDRDREWAALVGFATSATDEMRMGIVSGRRRQGKTFLLQSLAETLGGFYFVAVQSTAPDALRQLAAAIADYLELGVTPAFRDWDEAIVFLLDQCGDRVIVLDEFPYLLDADPAIASILQREIDARSGAGNRRSRVRLLLAGSAMAVMGRLLAGQAPLRGRASLDLVVQPFDYRTAADFWGVSEPRLATQLHAIVGGTPAYRTRFVDDEAPTTLRDFDDWVVRRVLSLESPLLREARYLLSDQADIRNEALYHAVLGAIAAGNTTRGGIANHMGRTSPDIAHPLTVLEDCQLIRREVDPVRKGAPLYRIAEPLITFYEAIMRNAWSQLELGYAQRVWHASRRRFSAQVMGPHFERLCREYALRTPWAGQFPSDVAAGLAQGGGKGTNIEVDVMALGPQEADEKRRLLSVGEAKWNEVVTTRHLDRLRQARDRLHVKGLDTRDTVLTLYGGAGFDADLTAAAAGDSRIALVDPDVLYQR